MNNADPTFPSPETAYAVAPSILSEIGWLAREMATRPVSELVGRDFYLRKAALLDRIALDENGDDDGAEPTTEAACAAESAACQLAERDVADEGGTTGEEPLRSASDPSLRPYVRLAYLTWHNTSNT